MVWLLVLAVLATLAALPLWLERRRDPVGDVQRRAAPGRFTKLSDGLTHYQWHGHVGGPVAVLVHGLTTSSYVWDGLIPGLERMGYRILSYDIYGRGLSERPATPQTRSFLIRQLRELLQDQQVEGDLTLIGYSMGGLVATLFAAEEPERIDRVVLIAPAGLGIRQTALAKFVVGVPYFGDWLNTVVCGRVLRRGRWRGPSSVPDIGARQAAETRTRGYLASVLSAQRNLMQEPLDEALDILRGARVPVLAIWGETDEVIARSAAGRLAQVCRDARQAQIPGAGHGLVHTHPDAIVGALQEFRRDVV